MSAARESYTGKINRRLQRKQHVIDVAAGRAKADLVLKNACYVNVFAGELCRGDIAIAEGLIAGMGEYEGLQELDVSGKVVCPGLIDAHIHLESSLVSPSEFARAVLPHGTTTVITDPHEITNVMGTDGIEYILEATEGLPVDVNLMLPSCVPSTPIDESGAVLDYRSIDSFYEHGRVLGLAEMMNYVGVVNASPDCVSQILASQSHHKITDGHAPGLSGEGLNAYVAAGVYSDHECYDLAGALEKLKLGQFIMIREGTAAKNLKALLPLLAPRYASRCMFATDDKHPLDLLNGGHIDYIIKEAIRLGADPLTAVQVASHNAARYFLLNDRGAIAPGYLADMVVFDDFRAFNVLRVYKNGVLAFDGETVRVAPARIPETLKNAAMNTFRARPVSAKDFAAGALPLIGVTAGEIVTPNLGASDAASPEKDILKVALVERHNATGHIGLGYIQGFGLTRGAIASSISHDSHNIIAIGATDADIAAAVNRVIELRGGVCVTDDGKILGEVPLPVAGLMSDDTLETVNDRLEAAKAAAVSLGAKKGIDPFMTLSFLALPVIPHLKLTTHGVFDVDKWQYA